MADKKTDHVFAYLHDVYGLSTEDVAALNTEAFIEKVKRTHKGLSAEHEFAAIASWLGKCSLITQLDSVLHSSDQYRVPDFLVVVTHLARRACAHALGARIRKGKTGFLFGLLRKERRVASHSLEGI
jgi:hypothetical protein